MSTTFRIIPLIPGLANKVALEIFLHFVAVDRDGPFTLMLVCTAWRDMVLGSKFLKSLLRDRRKRKSALIQNRDKVEEGICIASFDGGGPGSMSQLRILDEFMLRLAFKPDAEMDELRPADYFDLMGGVGFGGFVALLLGRLRMTTSQAMEELATIGIETFPKCDDMVTPDVNLAKLRQAVENMLERHGHSVDLKLRDSSDNRCKVVLFAATTKTMNHPHPFRTYRSRQGCLECTFVDAACAAIATPEYFSSVAIGPRLREQYFIGIPHGFDNPTREVLKEAQLTFGEQKPVSLVLSLGSGQRPRLSDPDCHATRLSRIYSDGVERDLQHQLRAFGEYLRLNVDRGMETIELEAWDELGAIESHTSVYLGMSLITNYIDRASQWLLQRSRSITLGQLSGTSTGSAVTSQSETLKEYLKMEFKQMHDIVQDLGIERITLIDAIGNHIPIPLEFCLSLSMLSGVIRLYFEHQKAPGCDFVERGDYRLVQGSRKCIVGPKEWTNIKRGGLMVEMSIILRTSNEDEKICPSCRTRFEGCTMDGWAQCLSCAGQFQTETRVQLEARLRSADITRFGAEDLIESSKVVSEAREPKSGLQVEHKSSEESAQLPFRLISVINLIRGMTPQSGSPPTSSSLGEVRPPSFVRRGHPYALEGSVERDHERERDRAPLSSAMVESAHRQYADRLEREKTLSVVMPGSPYTPGPHTRPGSGYGPSPDYPYRHGATLTHPESLSHLSRGTGHTPRPTHHSTGSNTLRHSRRPSSDDLAEHGGKRVKANNGTFVRISPDAAERVSHSASHLEPLSASSAGHTLGRTGALWVGTGEFTPYPISHNRGSASLGSGTEHGRESPLNRRTVGGRDEDEDEFPSPRRRHAVPPGVPPPTGNGRASAPASGRPAQARVAALIAAANEVADHSTGSNSLRRSRRPSSDDLAEHGGKRIKANNGTFIRTSPDAAERANHSASHLGPLSASSAGHTLGRTSALGVGRHGTGEFTSYPTSHNRGSASLGSGTEHGRESPLNRRTVGGRDEDEDEFPSPRRSHAVPPGVPPPAGNGHASAPATGKPAQARVAALIATSDDVDAIGSPDIDTAGHETLMEMVEEEDAESLRRGHGGTRHTRESMMRNGSRSSMNSQDIDDMIAEVADGDDRSRRGMRSAGSAKPRYRGPGSSTNPYAGSVLSTFPVHLGQHPDAMSPGQARPYTPSSQPSPGKFMPTSATSPAPQPTNSRGFVFRNTDVADMEAIAHSRSPGEPGHRPSLSGSVSLNGAQTSPSGASGNPVTTQFLPPQSGPPQPKKIYHSKGTGQVIGSQHAATMERVPTMPVEAVVQPRPLFSSNSLTADGIPKRMCKQCGQPGRYKDNKCVEKWGPGPQGPGTVCDRCRKKMNRVEKRATQDSAAMNHHQYPIAPAPSASLSQLSNQGSQRFDESQEYGFSQATEDAQSQPSLSRATSQNHSSILQTPQAHMGRRGSHAPDQSMHRDATLPYPHANPARETMPPPTSFSYDSQRAVRSSRREPSADTRDGDLDAEGDAEMDELMDDEIAAAADASAGGRRRDQAVKPEA